MCLFISLSCIPLLFCELQYIMMKNDKVHSTQRKNGNCNISYRQKKVKYIFFTVIRIFANNASGRPSLSQQILMTKELLAQ